MARTRLPADASVRGPSVEVFRAAAAEPSHGLDPAVREQLTGALPGDFSQVRVHSGAASRAAAASVGARAYTLGRNIHLGAEAARLADRDRAALLAHEAMHSIQQGMRAVSPSAGLPVSRPGDPAEREADRIGQAITAPAGGHPAHLAGTCLEARIAASVSPCIQRNALTAEYAVEGGGTFKLKFQQFGQEAETTVRGLGGTIEFTPAKEAPDSENIGLLQVIRVETVKQTLTEGEVSQDVTWPELEARRNQLRTGYLLTPEEAVVPGFFVDHLAAKAAPREHESDEFVSPYYGARMRRISENGRKRGGDIEPAWLRDYPHTGVQNLALDRSERFSFETDAVDIESGYCYASLRWGFTILNPLESAETITSEGKETLTKNEWAFALPEPSPTLYAAVKKFHEVYRNPIFENPLKVK